MARYMFIRIILSIEALILSPLIVINFICSIIHYIDWHMSMYVIGFLDWQQKIITAYMENK